MYRDVKISSVKYDEAEGLAFVQAIVGPVLIAVGTNIITDSTGDFLVAGLVCVLFFILLNLYKKYTKRDVLSVYQSNKYFEYTKYFFQITIGTILFAGVVLTGVYYA